MRFEENKGLAEQAPKIWAFAPKIAVIGDGMQDIWVLGGAGRVSPEAPVPIVELEDVVVLPGGAGNVARGLETLGLVEVIKIFAEGEEAPRKVRICAGEPRQQVVRVDVGDRCSLLDIDVVAGLLRGVKGIVVADYGKGAIGEEVQALVAHQGVPLFVDTKGSPSGWLSARTTFFPNRGEFEKHRASYEDAIWHGATVVLTQGAHGITVYPNEAKPREMKALARFVEGVAGAGDTVTAAWAWATLTGLYPPLEWASAAAALAVETFVTAAPSRALVAERYKEEFGHGSF